MAKLNLSPPWIILYNEMKAFFKEDNEVNVGYNDEEKKILLYVTDNKKATALASLIKEEVELGKVTVKICIMPGNGFSSGNCAIKDAFVGNGAFDHVINVKAFGFDMQFVIFKAKVVQYKTDDISDYYGLQSTLYEDIARDIFKDVGGVFYCTEPMVGAPLGEWP